MFESHIKFAKAAAPDAKIIWGDSPFILYKKFWLNGNFRKCLKTSLLSKKVFSNGCKKTLLQKSYELGIGVQSYTVDSLATNRQFHWL